jgi:hypothetical protein
VALALRSDEGTKGHDGEAVTAGIRDEPLDKGLPHPGSPQAFINCGVVGNDLCWRHA